MRRLTWIVRFCPHPPERGVLSHSDLSPPTGFPGAIRFGFTNYRLSLLLPPAIVGIVSYSLGWLVLVFSWFDLPYALFLVGMPLSFVCLLVQLAMMRDLRLKGTVNVSGIVGFVRRFWRTALVVALVYVSLVTFVRLTYGMLLGPLVYRATWNLQIPASGYLFALYPDPELRRMLVGMPDLYQIGAFNGDLIGTVLLIVPLNLFFWFTLTAGALERTSALDSTRLAVKAMRRNWRTVVAFGLVVAVLFELLNVMPVYQYNFGLYFDYPLSVFLRGLIGLSVFVIKSLLAPLPYLWTAGIIMMNNVESSR
jgi:hypothetical protein